MKPLSKQGCPESDRHIIDALPGSLHDSTDPTYPASAGKSTVAPTPSHVAKEREPREDFDEPARSAKRARVRARRGQPGACGAHARTPP
jgi:hypothetical protein